MGIILQIATGGNQGTSYRGFRESASNDLLVVERPLSAP